ncbi:MAG: amidohydrolase family protein [Bacilli bacterium]|nr:amidohydrolase family protein [Bacilli bacterium]
MIKIKSNNIVLLDKVISGFIYVENGKITDISSVDLPCEEEYDFGDKYVAPGFVEMHTHGGGGYAFINSTVEDVINGANFHLMHGTTSIVPTVTAGPFKNMSNAASNIYEASKSEKLLTNIVGVHMEGPYLSKEQCGAQCPTFITKPNKEDYVPFLEKYGSFIKKWTYAAENDDGSFAKMLSENGTIPSIGHSNAKYEDCLRAVQNGASMVTHLYSCTSTITRDHGFRSLGVTESAYLLDDLSVEIIADGKHLPKELIQLVLKNKGVDKTVLITDSLEIAGTDIKEGVMSGTEFIVEDGVCKLKDRSAFAGSVATDEVLIRTLLSCGASLTDAVKMLTDNPAKLLKLNGKGRLQEGYDADIVVFDKDINVTDVFVGGIKRK